MNDQLQKALADYLSTTLTAVKAGADLAADQIPLIIQEKLRFDLATSAAGFVGGLLIAVVYLYSLKRVWAWAKAEKKNQWNSDSEPLAIVYSVIGGAVAAFCFIGAWVDLYYIFNILLAPRLYIIEWLAGMIHGGK